MMSSTVTLYGETPVKGGLAVMQKDIEAAFKGFKQDSHLTAGELLWETLTVRCATRYPESGSWENGEPQKEWMFMWNVEVEVSYRRVA